MTCALCASNGYLEDLQQAQAKECDWDNDNISIILKKGGIIIEEGVQLEVLQ